MIFEFIIGLEKVVYGLSLFGMGIGKVWIRGVFDVDGSLFVYFDGDIYMKNKKFFDIFYLVGVIYELILSFNFLIFMGGIWEWFGNGWILVGVFENESEFNSVN